MAALTADIAFEQAANAAAARYEARPAYITYVSRTHVEVPSMDESLDVDRRVMVRSADDLAILQDLPHGAQTIAHGFPISPTFDALSYFRLNVGIGWHKRIFSDVTGPAGSGPIIPLRFAVVTHEPNDVVVTSLRYYYPKFAPDSSDAPDGHTHLVMQALPTLTTGNSSDFYISDVVIDNSTMLPLQVTYTGRDDRRFVVDYETIGGAWVIRHAYFAMTQYGVLHFARVHWTADATFGDYQFSQTPPDPRLAPK
jgi:hypothetical protein